MFVELNENNFQNETSEGLKLVEFYTDWCHFCKNQQVILDELSENGFWIGKVNGDKYTEIAQKYHISGFPSFILFKKGKLVAEFSGLHTKSQLLNKLTQYLT